MKAAFVVISIISLLIFNQTAAEEIAAMQKSKELAIESYERALALDPTQENPRKMLQQLRQE